jgi:hypothetical protein
MTFNFKQALPHLIAILCFYLFTVAYFTPLFQGKAIRQSDVSQFKGMSQEIVKHREQYGEEPLWTNSMFGGMPAYQISVKQPNNWMPVFDKVFKGFFLPGPSVYFFTCMVSAYILMLVLGLEGWLAAMGALAFALSTYFLIIIEAGHNTKAGAISYMPAVLAAFIMTYRGRQMLGAALAALFVGLELSQNHLQISYYLFLAIGLYVLFEFIESVRNKNIVPFAKSSVLLAIACILAVGPNITNILMTQEYGKSSTRGTSELTNDKENKTTGLDRDYITGWSFDKSEVLTLLIPNYFGGASGVIGNDKDAMKAVDPEMRQYVGNINQYWGNQPFTSGPTYAGAIICFLFVLALFFVEGPLKWGLLIATILSITLSWGKNFMGLTNFFLDYFPGYNKFRSVTMILVIAELTMPVLALVGLKKIIDKPSLIKEKAKFFYISFALTGGFALLVWLLPDMFVTCWADGEYENLSKQLQSANWPPAQMDMFMSSVEAARQALLKSDALRSFALVSIAAGLVWAYSTEKLNKNILAISITLISVGELWMVNRRYLNKENFVPKAQMDIPFSPNAANSQILQDPDPNFRVFNVTLNPFSDASTSYFHKSIGGYHGAKLKRYQEVIENHLSKNNSKVINMLNTKYFIAGKEGEEPRAQINPQAMGNAWFVKNYSLAANADSELNALNTFNPTTTAIVDKRYEAELKGFANNFNDSLAQVKLTSYKANELKYKSSAAQTGLIVFSEIYYQPGWNATIDGKPAPHFRTNYILRGMIVPAGTHEITFKFEPTSYKTGQSIALVSSILIFAFLGVMIFLEFRKNKTPESLK